MIDVKSMILHKCPKRGSHFPIDTKQTPVCPHCKFKVSKLVIGPHRFMKYVMISHLIPFGILLTLIITTDVNPLVSLSFTLPLHLIPFFAGLYLIAQNSLNLLKSSINEQSNWINRKR